MSLGPPAYLCSSPHSLQKSVRVHQRKLDDDERSGEDIKWKVPELKLHLKAGTRKRVAEIVLRSFRPGNVSDS